MRRKNPGFECKGKKYCVELRKYASRLSTFFQCAGRLFLSFLKFNSMFNSPFFQNIYHAWKSASEPTLLGTSNLMREISGFFVPKRCVILPVEDPPVSCRTPLHRWV